MEPSRKSFKSFSRFSNQHSENRAMAESSLQKQDLIVKIDGKETSDSTPESSASNPRSSIKKFKVSFEQVLSEALQKQSKKPENSSQFPSSTLLRKNSWTHVVNKAKSRLIDPPETINSEEEIDNHEEDDDSEGETKSTKLSTMKILQWISLALITAFLLCSIAIPKVKRQKLWDLPLWKWTIMFLTVISGHLLSGWVIRIAVILIEHNFLLRKRVLYFVYGLRKSVQNCVWLGVVLLVWYIIFDEKLRHKTKSHVLIYVTRILICLLVGNLIWLVKTLLVKVLALLFHVNTFFERIQDALFNQYLIQTLSSPPQFEIELGQEDQEDSGADDDLSTPFLERNRGFRRKREGDAGIERLRSLSQKNISAWNMRRMINIVSRGQLATLDEPILGSDIEDESSVRIASECQAKEAARRIFQKVAKPDSSCIHLDDLMRFMGKEEASKAMHMFGATCEEEGIRQASLNDWLVNAYRERRALKLSLNDTKTAVDELHNMLNIFVAIIIVIIWLLILGIPVGHFLVFISSQLLVAVFIFGDTCKRTFEAIVFLFIMHPFDVGDRCEIDQVQMVVEEMNILTTVFIRHDGQKITYPNCVLSSKPIGNFYRSPDMVETVEFCIHISTPPEKIAQMKKRIIGFIDGKEEHWHKNALVVLMDVEDMNKVKFGVYAKHRINYQNIVERRVRRGVLMEEMIKVFRDLEIEYRLLPLDVNVRNMTGLVPSN